MLLKFALPLKVSQYSIVTNSACFQHSSDSLPIRFHCLNKCRYLVVHTYAGSVCQRLTVTWSLPLKLKLC